jgi:hypothetical protein
VPQKFFQIQNLNMSPISRKLGSEEFYQEQQSFSSQTKITPVKFEREPGTTVNY